MLAEQDAEQYASDMGATYLGLLQSYTLANKIGQGAEVFSLMRDSALTPDEYLRVHFGAGRERQRTIE